MPNDATAVVLNVTATNPTAATFATLWPSGLARPNPASNLNVVPGQTAPNLVIVGIGANRKVSLYNDAGSTHFVVDVVGWYGGTTATKLFTPASSPARLLDSRVGNAFSTPWSANQTRDLTVAGNGAGAGRRHRGGDERDRHQPDGGGLRHDVPVRWWTPGSRRRTSTSRRARRRRTW